MRKAESPGDVEKDGRNGGIGGKRERGLSFAA